MPNRAPVLDSGPRIYVAVKSQDEETTMKMKRVAFEPIQHEPNQQDLATGTAR